LNNITTHIQLVLGDISDHLTNTTLLLIKKHKHHNLIVNTSTYFQDTCHFNADNFLIDVSEQFSSFCYDNHQADEQFCNLTDILVNANNNQFPNPMRNTEESQKAKIHGNKTMDNKRNIGTKFNKNKNQVV